jgi:hypothetical protein
VSAEARGGGAQVVLRQRTTPNGPWSAPEVVSQSPASAGDPTIAVLPGGDLAVAWSDTRNGASEIYYRARIGGSWTPEVRLTDLPGNSRSPSIGADDRGGIHLAWLYTSGSAVDVRFLYFPATAPIGDPVVVTPVGARPDPPLVTVGPQRRSYVLWTDHSLSPITAWFARFSPDSGVSTRYRLSPNGGANQLAVAAAVDGDGTLHSVWTTLSTGANELHYQRRGPSWDPPSLRDTTLQHGGDALQNPALALDPAGGIHIAWETSPLGVPTLRYKHYDPRGMWDEGGMEITRAQDGVATLPAVIAVHPTIVSVLYSGFPSGAPAWLELRRNAFAPGAPTAVPIVVPGAAVVPRPAPNPLRAARELRLEWAAVSAGDAHVDVLDVSGRRVARLIAVREGERWVAHAGAATTATWAPGVYFARIEGRASAARFVVLR